MQAQIEIKKLDHPEHAGDWHDAPLRWIVFVHGERSWASNQKFSTLRRAKQWASCVRNSSCFLEAGRKYCDLN